MWRRKTESESDLGQPAVTLRERLRCQSESNVCRITDGEDSSDSSDEAQNRDDRRHGSIPKEGQGKKKGDGKENDGKNVEDGKLEKNGRKEDNGKKVENGMTDDDGKKAVEQKEEDQSCGDAPVTNAVTMPSEESFSDFVQYEVSQQASEGLRLPRKQVPRTLMQACVESFHSLFHTILVTHIVKDTQLLDIVLDQLCRDSTTESPLSPNGHLTAQIRLDNLSDDVCEAFNCACQLLVDFSSFPMYCIDQMRVIRNSTSVGKWRYICVSYLVIIIQLYTFCFYLCSILDGINFASHLSCTWYSAIGSICLLQYVGWTICIGRN